MRKYNIEEVIKNNKEEMDTIMPSEALWQAISGQLPAQPIAAAAKAKVSGLAAQSVTTKLLIAAMAVVAISAAVLVVRQIKPESPALATVVAGGNPADGAVAATQDAQYMPDSSVKNNSSATVMPILIGDQHLDPEPHKIQPFMPVDINSEAVPSLDEPVMIDKYNGQPGSKRTWQATGKQASLSIDTMFTNVHYLKVKSTMYNINIKAGDDDRVSFRTDAKSTGKGLMAGKCKLEVSCNIDGDTLIVNGLLSITSVSMGSIKTEANMNFVVPASMIVLADNEYGNIDVAGLSGQNNTLYTRTGNILCDNMHTGLHLVTEYGNIKLNKIVGDIKVKLSTGNIAVNNLQGNIEATTSYGNQLYTDVAGTIGAQSTTGQIFISNVSGDVDLSLKYGNCKLDNYSGSPVINLQTGNLKGSNVTVVGLATFNSTYGNIDMELNNRMDELTFDLKATYGKLSINKDKFKMTDDNSIVAGAGPIKIKAVTETGKQSYR